MSGAQANPRLRPPTTGRLFDLASLPGYLDLLVCCIERRIMWEPNGMKYIVTRKMPPPVASVCSLLWYSLSHIKEVCRRNPSPRRQRSFISSGRSAVLCGVWPRFWKAGWKQPGLCFCPLPKDTSRETVGRCRACNLAVVRGDGALGDAIYRHTDDGAE